MLNILIVCWQWVLSLAWWQFILLSFALGISTIFVCFILIVIWIKYITIKADKNYEKECSRRIVSNPEIRFK